MAKNPKERQSFHLRSQMFGNPLMFWSGLLSVLIVAIAIAWYALSSPYFIAGSSARNGSLPLWSYGAIALFCAAGCLVVAQWLDREN